MSPMYLRTNAGLAARPQPVAVRLKTAAAMVEMSERTLWGHIHPRGTLKAVRIGGVLLVPIDSLNSWIAGQMGKEDSK